MKKRESLVVALLVVLALCVSALIVLRGMSDAQERAWWERPYEGTQAQFQDEHIELLKEAAAIFLAKPALFEQYFDWSGDATATIYRSDVQFKSLPHGMLTDEEWTIVQQLLGEQMCLGVYYQAGLYSLEYGWVDIPVFTFYTNTTEDGWGRLIWLPEDAHPELAARALETLRKDENIQDTAYPNWYVVNN